MSMFISWRLSKGIQNTWWEWRTPEILEYQMMGEWKACTNLSHLHPDLFSYPNNTSLWDHLGVVGLKKPACSATWLFTTNLCQINCILSEFFKTNKTISYILEYTPREANNCPFHLFCITSFISFKTLLMGFQVSFLPLFVVASIITWVIDGCSKIKHDFINLTWQIYGLGLDTIDFIAILHLHLTFYLQNPKSNNVVLQD